MAAIRFRAVPKLALLTLAFVLAQSALLRAQQAPFAALKTASAEPTEAVFPAALIAPAAPMVAAAPIAYTPVISRREALAPHHFWDRKNTILFASVAALGAADFCITRANLQNGGRELDPVTRAFGGGTRGLALNFSAETASMIGLSYFFHKTGHHKLERLTSVTNIGASGTAVAYDLAHR